MMDPMSALAMMNPFNSLNPMNFLNPNSNPYLAHEFQSKQQLPPEPLPVQVIEAPPAHHYRRSTLLINTFKHS